MTTATEPKAWVMKAPCKTCPYRCDVPSGIWSADEYVKLPAYDGDIIDQLAAGGTGLFMCHQRDGNLCAGWVACHGSDNLLALRLAGFRGEVKDEVWGYESPVPVFESGAAAAAHGMAELAKPGPKAKRAMARLVRKLEVK